jgi:hypothetical protein
MFRVSDNEISGPHLTVVVGENDVGRDENVNSQIREVARMFRRIQVAVREPGATFSVSRS